jgi:hypothetical protein
MTGDTDSHIVEVEELLVRPGTYFNPQTEVVVVVDDSPSLDQEIFNMEAYEGADWVRISDEVPVDENALDVALQEFQTAYHPGTRDSVSETALEQGDDEYDEGEDGQDPGREDPVE